MPWLLVSPGHQQPWYWLCRISRYLSSMRKKFNYLKYIQLDKGLATLPSHVFSLTLQGLAGELGPFICSGSHVIQKDSHPSAIHTFVEAMCQCVPNIPVRPCVLKVRVKAASDNRLVTSSDKYQWVCERLCYFQCISNGDTTVLHKSSVYVNLFNVYTKCLSHFHKYWLDLNQMHFIHIHLRLRCFLMSHSMGLAVLYSMEGTSLFSYVSAQYLL